MREFFNKYKGIILPLILIFIFFAGVNLSWGKWGHVIYDCFREAVLPQAILDGKVLYRDITNLYPPLGYYFNALLYLIFGNSLNTLYQAGIINSFLILSIIYFIVKKHSSDLIAFITVLSIMEIFTFKISASNTTAAWFFPYSYSFVYSFSTCLISLLFCILYRENEKPLYLYLSFLFIGLSAAFKLDFILFVFIPLYSLIKHFIGSKSYKTVLFSVGCLFAPFIASIIAYFTTGGTLTDIQNQIEFLSDFSKAPSVMAFNTWIMPQTFKLWALNEAFTSFRHFIVVALIIFLYALFLLFIISKLKNNFAKIISGIILGIFGLFTVIQYGAFTQYSFSTLHTNLSFVSYFVTISTALIFIFKVIKNKRFKNLEFTKEERFYFLITFCAALMSFRSFASLHISYIGNFIIIVWWINLVYLFLQLLPSYFPPVFKNDLIKKSFGLFFILYGFCFAYLYIYEANQMTYKLSSTKETFYGKAEFIPVINETVKYIEEEIPNNKTFLAVEEGVVFNYITKRELNLKYYALIPHMVDAYGEEKVIEDLSKNPPDYIFITNNIYITEKLGGAFGVHYAKKITAFVLYNYDYIKTVKNPDIKEGLEITIFKLKE